MAKPVLLHNLLTVEEWQCAFDAQQHADPHQKVTLNYGVTGEPDITLVIVETDQVIVIHSE